MVGQISDQDIAGLFEDPKRVEQLLNVDKSIFEKKSIWKSIFGKTEKVEKPANPYLNYETCDFGKSWHILHFLFTGTMEDGEFPQNFIVVGGKEVGEDFGYGPIRTFNAAEVKEINSFLKTLDTNALRHKMNLKDLQENDIYPAYAAENLEQLDWVFEELDPLRNFISSTSDKNLGLYVYIH